MFRSKRAWRSVALLGTTALALSGCGDRAGGNAPDGQLRIGTLLPHTGSLAVLGPPTIAGVDLAIRTINEAGGVLGRDVKVFHEDSGDTETDTVNASADKLISQGISAIVGAASSGLSMKVIDKLYDARVVQVSPTNSSPAFTTYPKGDYYFRTAPSDVLQGRVLADLVASDENATAAILARDDTYGTALADFTEASFATEGGTVVLKDTYDPDTAEFTSEVAAIKNANPDAIILITFFDEIRSLAPSLVKAGLGPDKKKWYFVDGNLSNYGNDLPKGMLDGTSGTLFGAEVARDFKQRLLAVNNGLKDFSYAPESYDATILIALAAIAARSFDSDSIRQNLVAVSKGGMKCTAFADCVRLLNGGTDIDYDGISGPIEFSDVGDITAGAIGIYKYGIDNNYTNVAYRFGKI